MAVLVPHPGGQSEVGFGTHRLGATPAISMALTHGHLEGVGEFPALQSHVGTMGMQTGLEQERGEMWGGIPQWRARAASSGAPWGDTSPDPHPAMGPSVSV